MPLVPVEDQAVDKPTYKLVPLDETPAQQEPVSNPPDPPGTVDLEEYSREADTPKPFVEADDGAVSPEPSAEDKVVAQPDVSLGKKIQRATTEDTYVSQQAAATFAQVVDFFPAMTRGIKANVKNAMVGLFGNEVGSAVADVLSTGLVERAVGKERFAGWLDASGRLREDTRKRLMDAAIEQGGTAGAVAASLVDSVEQTLMNIQFFKLLNVGYGERLKEAHKLMKSFTVLRGALARAGLMTVTQEQMSFKDAVASFRLSVAYQSTPAVSGWMGNNAAAISADIIQNSAITATQYNRIFETGKQQAIDDGHPERADLYGWIGIVQAVGSDIVFGAMTRTFNESPPPKSVRDQIAKTENQAQSMPRNGTFGEVVAELAARGAAGRRGVQGAPVGGREQTGALSGGRGGEPVEGTPLARAAETQAADVQAREAGLSKAVEGAQRASAGRGASVQPPAPDEASRATGGARTADSSRDIGPGEGQWPGVVGRPVSEMTRQEFLDELNLLRDKVAAAEKEPGRKVSPQESALMSRDWKAYSRERGYTEQEIADFERLKYLSGVRGPNFDRMVQQANEQMASGKTQISVPARTDDQIYDDHLAYQPSTTTASQPESARAADIEGGSERLDEPSVVEVAGRIADSARGKPELADETMVASAIVSADEKGLPIYANIQAATKAFPRARFHGTSGVAADAVLSGKPLLPSDKAREEGGPLGVLLSDATDAVSRDFGRVTLIVDPAKVVIPPREARGGVAMVGDVPSDAIIGIALRDGDASAPKSTPTSRPVYETRPDESSDISTVRENLSDIMQTLPKSTVARGRAKAEAKGRKDVSLRIEDAVSKVVERVAKEAVKPVITQEGPPTKQQAEAIESAQETFYKAVDQAVKDIAAPMEPKSFRNRLFQTKQATPEQLDALAVNLHPELNGTEAPRRQLTLSELRTAFPKMDRSRLRDAGMVADMVKTAYDAESPADALQRLNELNMIKKRPLITDVAGIARGGEPLADRPTYTPSDEERASIIEAMPKKLREDTRGAGAIDTVISQMERPLSSDPKSRRLELHLMSKLAYNAWKYGNQTRADQEADYKRLVSIASNLESMRYVFADIATKAADPTIFQNYREVDLRGRRATTAVEKRLEAIFDRAGAVDVIVGGKSRPMQAKRYVQSHPKVNEAIKVLISVPEGKTPESANSQKRAAAQKVLDDIPDPKHRKQMIALKDGINEVLQTVAANDVRRLQVYRFGDLWREEDSNGVMWGQKFIEMRDRGASRTPSANEAFGRMKAKLEAVLPKFNDNGKAAFVPVEEMIALDRGYNERVNTMGRDAANQWLIAELDKVSWGTRKAYYMSEKDREDFQLVPKVQDTPGFTKKQAAETLAATGEINSRTGMSYEKSGDLISSVYKHMHVLATQADTYHQANALRASIGRLKNQDRLPQSVYNGVDLWINSQWGKYRNPNDLTKLMMKGNAAFWTAYPMALTRIAWYSARNMLYQGAPWGPLNTQFRPGDVAANYARVFTQMADKNSNVRRYYEKRFRSDISQANAIFYEQSLMQDPSAASVAGRVGNAAMQTAWRWSATAIGMSDQANRIVGLTGYLIADKHINSYIDSRNSTRTVRTASGSTTTTVGKSVTKADVFHRLRMETTHLEQQRQWLDLFDRAKDTPKGSQEWERLKEFTTEVKEENINFIYRIGGKSPWEQNPDMRPTIGLVTYQRGTYNELARNGFAPVLDAGRMVKAGEKLNAEQFRDLVSGMQTIGMSMLTHALSSAIAGYLIGEKRDEWNRKKDRTRPTYSLVHSMMWRRDTPGQGTINKMAEDVSKIVYTMATGDKEENRKSLRALENQALYFVPMLPTVRAMFEASGNYEGVSNLDFLMGELENSMPTYRNRAEKWAHVLFDTANEHDQRWEMGPLEGFGKRLKDAETVHQIPRNTAIVLGLAEPEEE